MTAVRQLTPGALPAVRGHGDLLEGTVVRPDAHTGRGVGTGRVTRGSHAHVRCGLPGTRGGWLRLGGARAAGGDGRDDETGQTGERGAAEAAR